MSDTGLVATNFIMKSFTGTVVDLPLCPFGPKLATADEKIEEMAYLVMKHHISMACYADIAAHFPQLPRKHKVHCTIGWLMISYSYLFLHAGVRCKKSINCSRDNKNTRMQRWRTIQLHGIVTGKG